MRARHDHPLVDMEAHALDIGSPTKSSLFDYSKCAVNDAVLDALEELAREAGVEKKRDAMFAGEIINITEERAVLHTALRNRANTPVLVDGHDVMPDVNAVLDAMGAFSDGIRSGALKGHP